MEYETQRRGLGALGYMVAAFGLVFAYMASLHNAEIAAPNLISFAIWAMAFLLLALLLEWFGKWLVILALALMGYMWWTGNPAFERYASNAKDTRNQLCRDAQGAFPDAPVSEYLCP
ncbi:MAG: hypothetical protein AAF744_02805 [Pseudomonadota bacterium]